MAAREGRGLTGARIDGELLVLRSDAPALPRLRRLVKLLDQLIDALGGRRLAARAEVGHGGRTLAGPDCRRKARRTGAPGKQDAGTTARRDAGTLRRGAPPGPPGPRRDARG